MTTDLEGGGKGEGKKEYKDRKRDRKKNPERQGERKQVSFHIAPSPPSYSHQKECELPWPFSPAVKIVQMSILLTNNNAVGTN